MAKHPQSHETLTQCLNRLKPAFAREKTICRLFAAWCAFAALTLLTAEGDFFDLSFAQNVSTVSMVLLIFLFFVVFTAVATLLPRFETDTWFLLLAATVCVIRWLSVFETDISYPGKSYTIISDDTLFTLAVIVAYALFVFYFLQKNHLLIDKLTIPSKAVMIVTAVCGLLGGAVIAVTTCLRYLTFSSPNFDFGLFCNMFHYMKETGLPLVTSERDVLLSHFVVHLSPIYYVLLPFYAIFPSPLTLQIAQAVIVASGIVPTVLLARHFKLSGRSQVLIAVIYAAFPAISMGCFYDFHENCFLLPLLLWMFYFFEREKPIPMYIFAVATLLVKEDAAIYVFLFALYVLLSRKKYLHGTILAVGAVAYFAIALTVLNEAAIKYAEIYASESANPAISGPMINRFNNLIYAEDGNLLGAIMTALKNPGYLLSQIFSTDGAKLDGFFSERSPWAKLVYCLYMLLPVGLIPFCTKKQSRWLLLAPILLNIVTTYKYQYSLNFQYHFGVTAFLLYAMVQNLPDLKPVTRRHLLSLGAISACCIYITLVMPKFTYYNELWDTYEDRYTAIEAALDTLPEDASAVVPSSYLAHVHDREVYELGYHGNEPNVDYVVVRGGTDEKYQTAYAEQGYTVIAEYDCNGVTVIIMEKP